MEPSNADLGAITEQVWSAYLDPDGENPLMLDADPVDADEVNATVSVSGAWTGHVLLGCTSEAAKQVAAAMFGMLADEVSLDEVGDALGEVANVLGGNIKSLLPQPSTLSLPQVSVSGRSVHPGCLELARVHARWHGEPFTVALLVGALSQMTVGGGE